MQQFTYEQFLQFMRTHWKQGQHIGICAPTGSGKSFAALDLISIRKRVVAIATKAKDETLDQYPFSRRKDWPPDFNETRVLLWVKPKQLGDFESQRYAIYTVMDDLYKRGGWAIYFDDLYYVVNTLNLKKSLQMFYTQVRSNNVSIIASMQRPRLVLLEAISQATYILLFKIYDKLDLDRCAEGTGIDRQMLRNANEQLEPYEFLLLQHGKPPILVHRKEI